MLFKEYEFIKAVPVWEDGMAREMNHALRFETEVDKLGEARLALSGYTGYSLFINGEFIHFGPARAGRGYYRVDEIDIGKYLTLDKNKIEIYATGYYCACFEWLKEPSFICAEIISGGQVISCTGGNGWRAYTYPERVKRVQRYSFQRPFAEVYDMHRSGGSEVLLSECEEKNFIAREVSYPEFPREKVAKVRGVGSVMHYEPEKYYKDRAIYDVGKTVDGFLPEEAEVISIHRAEELKLSDLSAVTCLPITLHSDTYAAAEMAQNVTGLIEINVECKSETELYITFDELLVGGKINVTRNLTSNVVLYKLAAGRKYRLITAEPYTFKHIDVISCGGEALINYIGVIRCDFNSSEITKCLDNKKNDEAIERIYNAAIETFRQNTFDIYMDCPSRERAGWLCDSFFTSRVERLLTGKSTVEKCFLANYAMEDSYKNIPEGMLPMCYPSEFKTEEYIPNWAMWYLIEIKEYLARTNDRAFVLDLYPKMERLAKYFERFENERGLLERLGGWIFVEWSMCNNLVQDINYPTNMLYYAFLKAMYELYGDKKHLDKAEKLRSVIRAESRMDLFFCDNAVLENGEAHLSEKCTETCQYYAFFTGVATREEDGELWETMVRDFGPARKETKKWENIYPSNAFIGNYLRLELIADAGLYDKLERDIVGFFDYMAKRTGTLWEYIDENASCNHGFASHVLVWLDMLGYLKDK